jgi:predicted nucleic acid-binding protein
MAHLVDTSILVRLANTADALHAIAAHAVLELHQRGEVLHVTAQNLIELRNLATRPKTVNGLGLLPVDAEATAATFEGKLPLLAETADIYPAWKALVNALGVIGKQVHDARLVAVCRATAGGIPPRGSVCLPHLSRAEPAAPPARPACQLFQVRSSHRGGALRIEFSAFRQRKRR